MIGPTDMHVDDVEVGGPEDFDYGKRKGSRNHPAANPSRFGCPLRRFE